MVVTQLSGQLDYYFQSRRFELQLLNALLHSINLCYCLLQNWTE